MLTIPVVLKVFPNTTANPPKYYNEKSRLLSLNHPHVLRLIQAVDTAPTPAVDQGNRSHIWFLSIQHMEISLMS